MKLKSLIRSEVSKRVYFYTSISIILAIISLSVHRTFSLTNGPTQPETSGFKPNIERENVELFSGDFNYSIPLFNIGAYPFSINYNSNVSMEEEASWVGLGWNLNTGSISRNLRGFPDDFLKDTIAEERNQKKNVNVSVSLNVTDPELFTFETPDLTKKLIKNILDSLSVSATAGITFIYNNYSGISFSKSGGIGLNLTSNTFFSMNSNIGFSTGDGGLTISPSMSFDKTSKENIKNTLFSYGSMGFSYNSLKGIQQMNFGIFDNKAGFSFNNRELISTPYTPFPYKNSSFSFNPKTGITLSFADLGVSLGITYGTQKLIRNTDSSQAYGYMYMYGKSGQEGELLDFSREKDNAYMPGNPYLPQTFMQPDIFCLTSSLINCNYRAFQNSASVVSSPSILNNSEQTDIGLGIEFGGGNASDFGGNVMLNTTTNQSGVWIKNNSAGIPSGSTFALSTPFRNIYFRSIDSPSRSPFQYTGGQIQRFGINGNAFNYNLMGIASVYNGKYNNYNNVLEPTIFTPLTKEIISRHPFYDRFFKKYDSSSLKTHQISGCKVKDSNGNTMIFGCPAVNHIQKEVAFNVEGPNDNSLMYIGYSTADAGFQNQKGLTNFYSSRTMPAYAYAFMLTHLFTSEYSDLKGDGPTPDDPGDYVLFSYAKKIERYKWRTPYTKNQLFASYNPNIHSLYGQTSDDIASYSYGEKDIWYVDTVRSKHQMAVFYTSTRMDAREALGEHGGKGSRSMHKLDSIRIYNIHSYYQSLQQNISPVPEKKIIFKYRYDLCKGVFNQVNLNEGKLTLTELIIIDNNSGMGYHHSYKFGYSSVNPSYDPMKADRWGNYDESSPVGMNKLDFPYTTSSDTMYASAWRLNRIDIPSGGRILVEYEQGTYSYVQNKPAMQMFRIAGVSNSPGNFGSELHDGSTDQDYYIFFETDIHPTLPLNIAEIEFKKYFDTDLLNNLYFKTYVNISPSGQHKDAVYGFAEAEDYDLVQINNIYYGRIKLRGVPVGRNSSSPKINPITKAAIHFSLINTPRLAFGHPDLNSSIDDPIDFVNRFVNEVLLNTGIINNLIKTVRGPQRTLFESGVGRNIIPDKSFIRLNSRLPKPGYNSRVKRVIYENSWNIMSPGESGSSVVKEYIYTNEDGKSSGVATYEPQTGGDENPLHLPYTYKYQTQHHSLSNWARNLVPSPDYMGLYPLCETVYPAPSVGYQRVTEITRNGTATNGYIIHHFCTPRDYPVLITASSILEKTPTLDINAIFVNLENKHCVVSQGFEALTNNMNGKVKKIEYYDGYNRLLKKITNYYSVKGKSKFYHSNNVISSGYSGLENDVAVDFREESSISTGKEFKLNSNSTILPLPLFLANALGSYNYSEIIFRSATITSVWYHNAVLIRQEVEDRGADVSTGNIYFDPLTGTPLLSYVKNTWNRNTYKFDLPAYYVYPQMGTGSGLTGHYVKISTNSQGQITSNTALPLSDGDLIILMKPIPEFAWIIRNNSGKFLIDKQGLPLISVQNIYAYVWDSGRRNYVMPLCQSVTFKKLPDINNSSMGVLSALNGILSAEAITYKDFYSFRCSECGCGNEFTSDSLEVYLNSNSTEPVYLPYTIKHSCTCNGIITLYPHLTPLLTFIWPSNNSSGLYMQNLCNGQNIPLQVYYGSSLVGSFNFTVPGTSNSVFTQNQILNPIIYKLKNSWAPYENFAYTTSRTPVNTTDSVKLSEQGQFSNFCPFWQYSNGWIKNTPQWTLTDKNTFIDLNGNSFENKNIINNYNAATYSFKGYLQESITLNANNNEICYDSFEDYFPFYSNTGNQPWQNSVSQNNAEHFRLSQGHNNLITLEKPHTGYYSLKLPPDTTLVKQMMLKYPVADTIMPENTSPPFLVQQEHCADIFAPTPGKKYLVSFWVSKQDTSLAGLQFKIYYDHSPLPYNIEYISPQVEGWKQFNCSFTLIGRQCGILEFILINSGSSPVFIDDFRTHPFDANMKSFVYDPFSLKLMAVLDENNFAEIIQYDSQQQIQNNIKETEKGRFYINYRIRHLFRK